MLFHIYMKTFPHWLGLPPIQRSPILLYFESSSLCHSIWHSSWQSIWHSIWPSIWHSIWHSIGHISWRSIWHSVRVWRAPESWRAIGYVPQNFMVDNHFPPTIFLFGVFTIFGQNHTSYCWLIIYIIFPLPMPYPTILGSNDAWFPQWFRPHFGNRREPPWPSDSLWRAPWRSDPMSSGVKRGWEIPIKHGRFNSKMNEDDLKLRHFRLL